MALRKFAATVFQCQNVRRMNVVFLMVTPQIRNASSLEVTKNICILSEEKKDTKVIDLKLDKPSDKPLVVMLSWLLARKKHVFKYADIYFKHGFDVLNVTLRPWDLLWPNKGSQVVAKDILKFLDLNNSYNPLVLHGFSVGGYLWGEVLVNIAMEPQRYDHVLQRIAGQVWDSAADVTEISIGLPRAVFPRNKVLENALRQYMEYHMKTFDKVATRHYIRSSQMFHTNLAKAPAQFFLSKSDPIGAEASNQRVRESWESMGIPVQWKCWAKSPHVGHLRTHQKEYQAILNEFLQNLNVPNQKQKLKVQS